jgi:hypothetical protein
MDIHLVEQINNFFKMQGNIWESGWWSLDENKAKDLIGGKIYFHKKQQEPSFYGGTITGYRIEQDGQHQGRVVFKLKYSEECRNVKTGKYGWSKKMKIIVDE